MNRILVPEPATPDGSTGQWSAFLYQRCPGTYEDVAQSLGVTPATAYSRARTFCRRADIQFPLVKRIEGERRIVR